MVVSVWLPEWRIPGIRLAVMITLPNQETATPRPLCHPPATASANVGIMKAMALKTFVGLFGAFAAYYAWFLGSVFHELYGPSARFCATAQVWALQGGAVFFAPPALLGSVGLWFAGRQMPMVGAGFSRASRVVVVILILCALTNLVILF